MQTNNFIPDSINSLPSLKVLLFLNRGEEQLGNKCKVQMGLFIFPYICLSWKIKLATITLLISSLSVY